MKTDTIDFLDRLAKRLEVRADELGCYSMAAQANSLRSEAEQCRKVADEIRTMKVKEK